MLRILAIRLLLAFSLPRDLGGVPDPQLKVQFRQQSLEPAPVPAGFHPQTYFHSLYPKTTVELLRFFSMLQSALLQYPSVSIHKSNLLEGRVVIASYNQHIGSFSPGPFGWFAPPSLLGSREPTLSWNQLHSWTVKSKNATNARLVFWQFVQRP